MRYLFARLDEERKLLENFEKTLKIFDENSIAKLNFYLFLEKLLLKIEPSDITPLFYNNFFGVGGGGDFPPFPLATPLLGAISTILYLFMQTSQFKLGIKGLGLIYKW